METIARGHRGAGSQKRNQRDGCSSVPRWNKLFFISVFISLLWHQDIQLNAHAMPQKIRWKVGNRVSLH